MTEQDYNHELAKIRRLWGGSQWTRKQQEEFKNRRAVFHLNRIKTNPKGPMSNG